MSEPAQPTPNIAALLSPVLYGTLISWALFGLLVHQVFTYLTRFSERDQPLFKALVYVVFLVECACTALFTHFSHGLLIVGWGNPLSLMRVPWSGLTLLLGSSTTAVIVQPFFAWRIWKLNRESIVIRCLSCVVPLISFVNITCAIIVSIKWVTVHHLDLFEAKLDPEHAALTLVMVVAHFSADILITILLVISLLGLRQKSGAIRSTVALINYLIVMAVETGTITTIVAVAALVLYVHPRFKLDTYFVVLAIPMGRFYSTMFLANLTGRGFFSGASSSTTVVLNTIGSQDVELKSVNPTSSGRKFEDGIKVSTNITRDDGYSAKVVT